MMNLVVSFSILTVVVQVIALRGVVIVGDSCNSLSCPSNDLLICPLYRYRAYHCLGH